MQGEADKEISRLIQASRKAIQKIKEDVVKEVKQLLEKSIKKQTELVSLLDFKAQRWFYDTRNSPMQILNHGVQFPSQDQCESLLREISKFRITGVLHKDNWYFFVFSNGLKTNSGCAPPMTEHLINQLELLSESSKYNTISTRMVLTVFQDLDQKTKMPKHSCIVVNEDEIVVGMSSKPTRMVYDQDITMTSSSCCVN